MKKTRCLRCENTKLWSIRRAKLKCSKCRYEWAQNKLPLNLTKSEWKKALRYFLLGLSSNKIASETGLNKQRVLRALGKAREVMIKDIPEIFEGHVEVDETYIGGQWKNKRKSQRLQPVKRGRGTPKQPVFGILCRGGYVWAEIVPNVKGETLKGLIEKKIKKGSTIYSDTWDGYTGIAAKGYVHRLVDHSKGEYSDGKGNHINGLEGFWGYLKRILASKGGIRKDKLHLYLGEFVWKYNNRNIEVGKQVDKLLKLLHNFRIN